MGYTDEQPLPNYDTNVDIIGLVHKDLEARAERGAKKYGDRLTPFNGRDALVDAYQEALDLAIYLRQVLYEGDNIAWD